MLHLISLLFVMTHIFHVKCLGFFMAFSFDGNIERCYSKMNKVKSSLSCSICVLSHSLYSAEHTSAVSCLQSDNIQLYLKKMLIEYNSYNSAVM